MALSPPLSDEWCEAETTISVLVDVSNVSGSDHQYAIKKAASGSDM
jgi:hypothetical protein